DRLQRGADIPGLARILYCEVDHVDGAAQEGVQAIRVRIRPCALGNSIPEFIGDDRRGRDRGASCGDRLESPPDFGWPPVDESNQGVGVEQVGHSKTSRAGVAGWSRPSGMNGSAPRLSSSANHSVGSRMGSRRTPRPTRRMRTRSPRNLNSCGKRTAWLRPLRKSFATPASGILSSNLLIYTAVYTTRSCTRTQAWLDLRRVVGPRWTTPWRLGVSSFNPLAAIDHYPVLADPDPDEAD